MKISKESSNKFSNNKFTNIFRNLFTTKEFKFAILSGVLIGTSYIPFPPWAVFFCMAPLWSQWPNLSLKRIFWTGWVAQFILAMIGFHWIPYSIIEYGHLPKTVGVLGLLLFAAFTNLHIPLAGVLWFYVIRKLKAKNLTLTKNQSFFLIALFTALLETLNPQIFPWHFGYTWYYGDFPAYQLAELIGFSGLSALNYILNAWILVLVVNIRDRKFFQKQVTYFVLLFSAINIAGLMLAKRWQAPDSSAKILMVQPNIGNQDKQFDMYGAQTKGKTVQAHLDISKPYLSEKPDFILWPETSIPEFLNREYQNYPNVKKVFDFAKENQIYIVTGAYTHNVQIDKQSNTIFVISPEGRDVDFYKKNVLLPFGEYIPLGDIFTSVYKWLPMIANFERGRGPHSIQVGEIKLGPQICYEGLHPWFSKGLIEDNSQIIINVTNDSWFGHTFESYQHLYMTLARAIEFRRPLVRVTNTGISAVVDATGRIIAMSPQKQQWAQVINTPYLKTPGRTLYSYFVNIDLLLIVLGILLLLKPYLKRSRKSE